MLGKKGTLDLSVTLESCIEVQYDDHETGRVGCLEGASEEI